MSINGAPTVALLDSGAQRSVVDLDLARRLGLQSQLAFPVVAFGVGGGSQIGRAVTADVGLSPLTLPSLRLTALTIGPLASAAGLGAPLVLGQDVLGQLAVDIDFPNRRLRFISRGGFHQPAGFKAVSARRRGGALVLDVAVGATAIEAILDTGASSALSVSDVTARRLGLVDAQPSPVASMVLGGAVNSRMTTASRLTLFGRTFADVEVQVFPPEAIPGFPQAVLGVESLRDMRVVIDLGSAALFVRPVEVVGHQGRPLWSL